MDDWSASDVATYLQRWQRRAPSLSRTFGQGFAAAVVAVAARHEAGAVGATLGAVGQVRDQGSITDDC